MSMINTPHMTVETHGILFPSWFTNVKSIKAGKHVVHLTIGILNILIPEGVRKDTCISALGRAHSDSLCATQLW